MSLAAALGKKDTAVAGRGLATTGILSIGFSLSSLASLDRSDAGVRVRPRGWTQSETPITGTSAVWTQRMNGNGACRGAPANTKRTRARSWGLGRSGTEKALKAGLRRPPFDFERPFCGAETVTGTRNV
jgi:hypothetical protein